jgi:hypothetical protein
MVTVTGTWEQCQVCPACGIVGSCHCPVVGDAGACRAWQLQNPTVEVCYLVILFSFTIG